MQNVARNLNETYAATADSVARARSVLSEFAAAAGATPEQVDGVRLAVSEAMTNSVLHAYRGEPGQVHVNAAIVSGELWILVSDDGCGLEPRADRPGLGLGLGLIAQVSDDFAIVSRASGGTEVRIRFNIANAPADPDPTPSQNPAVSPRGFPDPGAYGEPSNTGFSASVSA
ncbi:MAG: ATP-binding protein [Solirubrobacteraceae bacterium]